MKIQGEHRLKNKLTKKILPFFYIYDQLGRLVERAEVDAAYNDAYRINTADFTSGLYLISVQAGNAPAMTKQLVILPH